MGPGPDQQESGWPAVAVIQEEGTWGHKGVGFPPVLEMMDYSLTDPDRFQNLTDDFSAQTNRIHLTVTLVLRERQHMTEGCFSILP